MKYLFNNWNKLLPLFKKASKIQLFLDYDGTLTPIVDRPEHAKPSKAARLLLQKLAKSKHLPTLIISGRSIAQAKKIINIKGLQLAGNHGLEIESKELHYVNPAAKKAKPFLKEIKRKLDAHLRQIKGAIVEDKGLSLSVHFRLVAPSKFPELVRLFRKITRPYIKESRIKITKGKRIFEIRPPVDWNKGKLIQHLLKRKRYKGENVVNVYIGDDRTDEDAFYALRKGGITVYVGRRKASSCAKYFLKDTEEVLDFLLRIYELKA